MKERDEVVQYPNDDKTALLAKLISRIGPEISQIAAIIGEHKETLRYRYKEKILSKGMTIQAVPDEKALGLKRIAAKVRVSDLMRPYAQQMFWAMNDLCFVVAFESILPEECYVLHACVPDQMVQVYKSFILELQSMGFFESVEFYEFDWFRRIPMCAEYYDFDEGRWDYDWTLPIGTGEIRIANREHKAKFDRADLLMLKEFQIDACRDLTDIRNSILTKNQIDMNYKTLQWHYHHHVMANELIKGYSIRWIGTGYNSDVEKAEHRRHRYIIVNVVVKDLKNEQELLWLVGKLHQTPFLWSEMAGKDYLGQCAFPVEESNEAFEYLREVMRPYQGRVSHYLVDQKNSIQFVLPYKLWDDSARKWVFERENISARFENLILKIKNGIT